MKENDIVSLIFVTHHNHIAMVSTTLKDANNQMRHWYNARDTVMNKKDGWEEAERWLKCGTFAVNYQYDDSEETHAEAVVAVEHIIGMYVKDDSDVDVRKTAAEAVKKMADVMDRETRRGDEWRSDEGD